MRILLDTHIFLWCVKDDVKLSKAIKSYIQSAEKIYVSSASIWEIAIKINLGKLEANINELTDSIHESGFYELPITMAHSAATLKLSDIHKDPFDRMLIAQANSEPLRLLTNDSILSKYSDLVDVM